MYMHGCVSPVHPSHILGEPLLHKCSSKHTQIGTFHLSLVLSSTTRWPRYTDKRRQICILWRLRQVSGCAGSLRCRVLHVVETVIQRPPFTLRCTAARSNTHELALATNSLEEDLRCDYVPRRGRWGFHCRPDTLHNLDDGPFHMQDKSSFEKSRSWTSFLYVCMNTVVCSVYIFFYWLENNIEQKSIHYFEFPNC